MSLYDDEITLEQLANKENMDRIRSLKTSSGLSNSPQGRSLIDKAINTLSASLQNTSSHGTMFVAELIADWNAVSMITVRLVMNEAFTMSKKNSLAGIAKSLGHALVDHLNYKMYQSKHPQEYLRTMKHQTLHSSRSYAHRERAILWAMGQTMEPAGTMITLPQDQTVHLGMKLIRIFIEECGLAQIVDMPTRHQRHQHYIVPTPETLKYVEKAEAREALLSPILYPMIHPPAPWTSWHTGGYLLNEPRGEIQQKFIRSSRLHNMIALEHGLDPMFAAANYMGSIPWRINKEMLRTLDEAWSCGHRMVPKPESIPELPIRPWDNDEEYRALKERNPEIIKHWKQASAQAYNDVLGSPIRSARINMLRCLHVAHVMKDYERIYFPHNVDFRGRIYPIPAWVNPQGVDHARGLLEFSIPGIMNDPKTMTKGSAYYWHCVIGANLFGHDKVPMDDRCKWTLEHQAQIARSALEPLDCDWWHQADKPWQALAWCREHHRIVSEGLRETRIVCHQDGSCNGIQHLSLATRDEVGGMSVNLVPSPERHDIYTMVAEETKRILPADSHWMPYITRKVCKRGTMTLGYGVTRYGIAEQLAGDLPGILEDKYDKTTMHKTNDLATAIDEASHRIVVKGKQLMEWYQAAAKTLLSAGHGISWKSPLGFFILQNYPKYKVIEIQTIQSKQRLNVSVAIESPELGQNRVKNANAIAPNITHSMDAAHMSLTALGCAEAGLKQYAGIHDSFGTTADNIQDIRKILLVKLKGMYENYNPIKEIQGLAMRLNIELPKPPEQGCLDLNALSKCEYAFG